MYMKGMDPVNGITEQLKGLKPLAEEDGNPVYIVLLDKELTGTAVGKLVGAIHEHRPLVTNSLGKEELAPEKETKVLYDATPRRISLAITDRAPREDGTYNNYASVTLERGDKGAWRVSAFFTALDPTGYDGPESARYVDIADGVKGPTHTTTRNSSPTSCSRCRKGRTSGVR